MVRWKDKVRIHEMRIYEMRIYETVDTRRLTSQWLTIMLRAVLGAEGLGRAPWTLGKVVAWNLQQSCKHERNVLAEAIGDNFPTGLELVKNIGHNGHMVSQIDGQMVVSLSVISSDL